MCLSERTFMVAGRFAWLPYTPLLFSLQDFSLTLPLPSLPKPLRGFRKRGRGKGGVKLLEGKRTGG